MLRSAIDKLLGRRASGQGTNDTDADLDLPDDLGADALVAQLGLTAAATPCRARPGWRPPRRIVVTAISARRREWLQRVAPGVDLVAVPWGDGMTAAVTDADAIIGWCTRDMLASARELRWIQLTTAGIEQVLAMPELAQRAIAVTNLQKAAGPVIAEHVFAMLLSLARGMPSHAARQRRGHWSAHDVDPARFFTLREAVLLVVGLGGIGESVVQIANGFGMRVDAVRANPGAPLPGVRRVFGPAGLATAVRDADIVVNTLPLTDRTRGLYGTAFFEAMKAGGVFVNVARGASVDTDALVAALRSGKLRAAALDVADPEPLPASHPLWRMENVLLTPHVAGWGTATRRREWLIVRENLRRYVGGEALLSEVDTARGY